MMSHACGMGDEVPEDIVRLMLLLKVQSLSYGNSGVQGETGQRLIDFFNHVSPSNRKVQKAKNKKQIFSVLEKGVCKRNVQTL